MYVHTPLVPRSISVNVDYFVHTRVWCLHSICFLHCVNMYSVVCFCVNVYAFNFACMYVHTNPHAPTHTHTYVLMPVCTVVFVVCASVSSCLGPTSIFCLSEIGAGHQNQWGVHHCGHRRWGVLLFIVDEDRRDIWAHATANLPCHQGVSTAEQWSLDLFKGKSSDFLCASLIISTLSFTILVIMLVLSLQLPDGNIFGRFVCY